MIVPPTVSFLRPCLAAFAVSSLLGCAPAEPDDTESLDGQLVLPHAASCVLPSTMTVEARRAYERANAYRAAMGLSCLQVDPAIETAAANHCGYFIANRGACTANPHREVASCTAFKGERFGDRLRAAGYTGQPAYEVMTYFANGARAVDAWVDSIWHRIPLLSPMVRDMGYGSMGRCDTMDFGWGPSAGPAIATYPFAGQAQVPTKFDGRTEFPPPPAPPRGWPSGYPIIVYGQGLTIATHTITALDAPGAPLPHRLLSPGMPESIGVLTNEHILYTDAPLRPATTYRVRLEGTRAGAPATVDWTFTTR